MNLTSCTDLQSFMCDHDLERRLAGVVSRRTAPQIHISKSLFNKDLAARDNVFNKAKQVCLTHSMILTNCGMTEFISDWIHLFVYLYLITTIKIRNFCACSREEPASGSPYEETLEGHTEGRWTNLLTLSV